MAIREMIPEQLLGPLNEVERKKAPKRLFVAGDDEFLRRGARVSVVGSRKASAEALARTRVLVRELAAPGMLVVRGLAEGSDTVAHETALAASAHTMAVLGTPLDEIPRLRYWRTSRFGGLPPRLERHEIGRSA